MSLQAVLAVCPGEEGGSGGPPGCAPGGDPGPAAAARALRWVALGSWEWGLGRPHLPGQEPGTPATPSTRLPASPPERLPTTAPEPPTFKGTSLSIFFAPYSDELCHCVERKRGDPSDFKGRLVWLSCHP